MKFSRTNRIKDLFKVIDGLILFLLMGLGFYFIYKGDVLNRFQLKRTNFAEYTEDLSEIPTVTTWIVYASKGPFLKYWRDFKIRYYHWDNNTSTILALGENDIQGSKLSVYLEEFKEHEGTTGYEQTFRITPINFEAGMPHDFALTYNFWTNTSRVSTINAALSPRNSSYCGDSSTFYDGEPKDILAKFGQKKYLLMKPEKTMFGQDAENCRNMPYHDYLLETILKRSKEMCSKTCRPAYWRMCDRDIFSHTKIRICRRQKEIKCFHDIKAAVEKDITSKPCIVLRYNVEETTYEDYVEKTQVEFDMVFSPPAKVNVKEEYLIYDLITMVGAIGGTMGLCVGFSFRDCVKFALTLVEQAVIWMLNRPSVSRKTAIKNSKRPRKN